ncbi:MAG TPA: OmpA family protein [Polyangiaceae bacterium]|nr:OmpA family protein [Polyangiaceae bacterium]
MTRARTLALLALPFALTQCAQSSEMRGRIAGLEKIVDQAERNGAMRCAPRELAIARSQLEFANIELDQGFVSKAQAHLAKAEPNARAAELLSPPERCGVHPPDADGDGYADASDKCPAKAENFNGYQDEDGCPDDPDTDRDGIADSVDQCELNPEDKDGYLDTDGCPEPDNDLDGLLDAADKCPNEPEDFDGYEDEDGCPDPDNDKDSVPDVQDQCPNEIGSTTQEPLGCPGNRLAVVTDCEVKITQQIHFETNKDKIRPESYPVLNAVADVLAKNPKITLEVQGHTDNKGAAAYNKDLSKRRAQSVLKYLTAQGVTNSRLTAQGYGMERPLVDNSTADNRALNRRVQFVRSESSKEGCPKTGSGSP